MRILLIGAVVFLAAWFTILKPKPAGIRADDHRRRPRRPASAGKAVDAAKAAAGQTTETRRRDRHRSGDDDRARTQPEAAPAVAIPAEALAKLPKDVARALEARKVARARRVRRRRPSRGARCPTTTATCATPCATTTATTATSSSSTSASPSSRPTARWSTTCTSTSPRAIVVIDGNLKGRVLTGYVDRISINQVIADARDASAEPDITDPTCVTLNDDLRPLRAALRALVVPDDPRQEGRGSPRWIACSRIVRRLPPRDRPHRRAPAKWRSLKTELAQGDGRRPSARLRGPDEGRQVGRASPTVALAVDRFAQTATRARAARPSLQRGRRHRLRR